jgi:hypothetical protein
LKLIFSNPFVMEQMKLDGLEVIELNYDDPILPELVRRFKPSVWREGEKVCCLLGPDKQTGILGCGESVEDALQDWTTEFHFRLAEANGDDPIANEIWENETNHG